MYSVNRNEFDRSTILISIINGSYSVVKLPWKPKKMKCIGSMAFHLNKLYGQHGV